MTEKETIIFLKKLKRKKSMTREHIDAYFRDSNTSYRNINALRSQGLIQQTSELIVDYKNGGQIIPYEYDLFSIADSGIDYLEEIKKEKLHFWIPNILSALALIIAILSIVLSPFFDVFFSKLYGL